MRSQTVSTWRSRLVTNRLAGLADEPRCGDPRKVSDAQIETIGGHAGAPRCHVLAAGIDGHRERSCRRRRWAESRRRAGSNRT